MARRTARQIAASKRNIVAAQRRSAQLRKGKSFSKKTGHYYGTGKTGRRQARINKYGSRRHGISIAQQQRRDKRSNRRKRIAMSGATLAVAAHHIYKANPEVQKSLKTAAKDAKVRANRAKGTYKINRMSGSNRATSTKRAAKSTRRKK